VTLVFHDRTEWQLATMPVTGPRYPMSTIVDVLYHYPGGGSAGSFAMPIAKLRAMQADYVRNRDYSLGYNFCIDMKGEVWEVRGVDIKSAATAGYNDKSVAVQFFVPAQDPANDAQMATAIELHQWLENLHGRRLGVFGHYQKGTTATPCPGAGIKPQLPIIDQMAHKPKPPSPPPPGPTPTTGVTNMFIATWQEHWHYRVEIKWDGTAVKRAATLGELNLVGAGAINWLNDRRWDDWIASVPEA